jgi:hypothetical protein
VRKAVTTIILLLNMLWCKPQRILFYCVEKDYLSLHIEKVLANLENTDKGTKLFSKITNLNQVSLNVATEKTLRSYLEFYSSSFFQVDSIGQNKLEDIEREIRNYDFILIIKTNEFSGLLEYQFSLFDTNIESQRYKNKGFRTTNPTKPISTENIIIDPRRNGYLSEIENSLKRLFPISTKRPSVKIVPGKSVSYTSGNYFCKLNDTIELKSIVNTDLGKTLSYKWRNITMHAREDEDIADNFRIDGETKYFYVDKEGINMFGLTVSDGVKKSKEDTVTILAIKSGRIIIRKPSVYLKQRLFFNRKLNNLSPNKVDIICDGVYKNKNIRIQRSIRPNAQDTLNANLKFAKLSIKYSEDSIQYIRDSANYYHSNESYSDFNPWNSSRATPVKPNRPPPLEIFYKEEIENVDFSFQRKDWGYQLEIPFDTRYKKSIYDIYLEENTVKSTSQKIKLTNNTVFPTLLGVTFNALSFQFINPLNISDTISVTRRYLGIALDGRINRVFSVSAEVLFPLKSKIIVDTIKYLSTCYSLSPKVKFIDAENFGIVISAPFLLTTLKKIVKVPP